MSLTKSECLVAAACAEKYPKSRGYYTFTDRDRSDEEMARDPECVRLG